MDTFRRLQKQVDELTYGIPGKTDGDGVPRFIESSVARTYEDEPRYRIVYHDSDAVVYSTHD